ncbi:MAG: hypothetical protein JWP09_350 [Candidatus Taylorbacteria bacterium]|nr:hypothetical protein [Candidatus Taylorbacteria bacterium]
MNDAINTVEKYFELSNQANLVEIGKMFSADSIYNSSRTGLHHGAQQIMKMMTKFYAGFDELKWIINSIKETQSNIIEVDFTFNGLTKEGLAVVNTGTEYFVVHDEVLKSVEVKSR